MTTREILAAALALPRDARTELVDELLDSLNDDEAGSSSQSVAASPELRAFIRARREAALVEPGFSADEVFAELRARLSTR